MFFPPSVLFFFELLSSVILLNEYSLALLIAFFRWRKHSKQLRRLNNNICVLLKDLFNLSLFCWRFSPFMSVKITYFWSLLATIIHPFYLERTSKPLILVLKTYQKLVKF